MEGVISHSFKWLHISDFHFKGGDAYDRDVVLGSLVKSLPDLFSRFGSPDAIIVSGDIANSGKKTEYDAATAVFDEILAVAGLSKERFFVVPGNHDVDRAEGVGLARTLNSVEESDAYFKTGSSLLHVSSRMQAFGLWYDDYFSGIRSFPRGKTYSTEFFESNSCKVSISLFNSATFCFDDTDNGKLFIGRRSADGACQEVSGSKFDVSLAVMHHPLNWLHHSESIQIKSLLRDSFDCLLTGHMHENEIENVAGSSGDILHLCAGATYQTSKWPNTALICSAENGQVVVTPIRYTSGPRPVWALDTSLFPGTETYQGSFTLKAKTDSEAIKAEPTSPLEGEIGGGSMDLAESSEVIALQQMINDRLFITPSGEAVHAQPRLMKQSQESAVDGAGQSTITLKEIAESSDSLLIESRPEYGGSTLCRMIQLELTKIGKRVVFRSSRDLPNYKRKLESEFKQELGASIGDFCIILDDFDTDRDEKLLSELKSTNLFSRVILLSVNRRISDAILIASETLPFAPKTLYLWSLGRSEIRKFAANLLDASDSISISRAIDKVYGDLLALKIPLTPSNVVMYLRVLQREGDFEPLSRVDILSRYLAESLRRPSDTLTDSFNFKNKMDVLSAYAFYLHENSFSEFDERNWLNFCSEYQNRTLSEFDSKSFLSELVETRIVGFHGRSYYFKYSFYFTFFLGRYLWPRPLHVKNFFSSGDYLTHLSAIDVITGLSSENSEIITTLVDVLEGHLSEFEKKYVRPDFDPLIGAIWPDSNNEDNHLWKPVQEAIANGPASSGEIDNLKTSMTAEAMTSNQRISFEKFNELEHALFISSYILGDALKNADDVAGDLKVRAWEAIVQTNLTVLQVGTIFSPELAKRKKFNWGGLSFIDFNKASDEADQTKREVMVSVIISLVHAVSMKNAGECGSIKLAPVFRAVAQGGKLKGFSNLVNFECIATARGKDWPDTLSMMIEKTDKNAYYLSEMLNILLRLLRVEVMPGRDRESMKRLVALIQAKRIYSKQAPGSKAVTKMVEHLASQDYFPDNKGD